jgi:ABC-type hemin transport system ATPase subunit
VTQARVVLDDPTAGFDAVNQAGFVATLRAFVRLTRPDQVVVATHDDALAALLSEELAPVDGWPASTTRVRCRRDPDDGSAAKVEWTESASRATDDEAERLGLRGKPTLLA